MGKGFTWFLCIFSILEKTMLKPPKNQQETLCKIYLIWSYFCLFLFLIPRFISFVQFNVLSFYLFLFFFYFLYLFLICFFFRNYWFGISILIKTFPVYAEIGLVSNIYQKVSKHLASHSVSKTNHPEVFCKTSVLKNFARFTVNTYVGVSFLIKLLP